MIIKSETDSERIKRIIAEVEEIISTTGEHPDYELKRSWLWNTFFLKAEFIKDVQSIANSSISQGKNKFIIVGADEKTKRIDGCNHPDYDESSIRQLLETYLDSVPDYEILYPKSKDGVNYVIMRIPHQPRKPFIIKLHISDEKKKLITEGEIWIKPSGSTSKRRVKSKPIYLS